MPAHALEEEHQRHAGQREICNQAEVIRIGKQRRLLLDAAVEQAQSILLRHRELQLEGSGKKYE